VYVCVCVCGCVRDETARAGRGCKRFLLTNSGDKGEREREREREKRKECNLIVFFLFEITSLYKYQIE
jgi:hypothetical protein